MKNSGENRTNGKRQIIEDLLTPDKVCSILKISRSEFYKLVYRRELPAIKVGWLLRIEQSAFREFINARRRPAVG